MQVLLMAIGIILSAGFLFFVFWWWSEGAIDASDAILLGSVFCLLILGVFVANSVSKFLLAFVPLCSAAGYLIYIHKVGGVKNLYRERYKDYIEAIQKDPKNLGARELYSNALYNIGELDRAVDELQAAVDMGAGQECIYKLNKWKKEQHLRDTTNPVCRWCETENQPNTRTCVQCGFELPYDSSLSRWLMGGASSKSRYVLMLVVCTAITGVSILLLPIKFAFIPLGLTVLALIGWSLMNTSRK